MALCISNDNSMMATIHEYNHKYKVFIYDLENNVIQNEIEIDNYSIYDMFHIDFSCNNRYLAISNDVSKIAFIKPANLKNPEIQTDTNRNTHIYFSNGDLSITYVNNKGEIVF